MRSKRIINAVKIQNEVRQKGKFVVPVIVDEDKSLNYEGYSWIMKVMRIPIVSILNILPASWGRFILTVFSNNRWGAKAVCRWATTYKALEAIYTYSERRSKGEISITDFFWGSFLSNSRAVRNRLKLVKRELLTAIEQVKERKSEINLMSLGCGSARAIVEVLAQVNGILPIKTKLIDINRGAISFSKKLATIYNVNQIEWHQDYAQNLEKYCNDFQPDIVEMIGLLDYYSDEQAIDLLRKIYKVLSPGGWLITCNIRSNLERPFVTKTVNWPMIYRSPKQLASILIEAGFRVEYLKIIYEPLKIHGVAIAQKVV